MRVNGWLEGWSGHAITEDGQFRFEQTRASGWKVWKWDGKRWRRAKFWPDYLVALAEKWGFGT